MAISTRLLRGSRRRVGWEVRQLQRGVIRRRESTLSSRTIQVAPSGRYLAHADSTPFFFMADTCWNGPHLSEPDEWDTYLMDRAAKRFSAVIFTGPHFRGLEANADGRTAFTGGSESPSILYISTSGSGD